jgi:murein DD-endopeptidase MepM/ murein hydrolase activator NlpD
MVVKRRAGYTALSAYADPSLSTLVPVNEPTAPRPQKVALKKVKSIRFNWFLIGTLFGVSASFFMNFMISAVILPQYEAIIARKNIATLAVAEKELPSNPTATAKKLATTAHKPSTSDASKSLVAKEGTEVASLAAVYPRKVDVKVGSGDTLIDVLMAQHVQEQEAHNVVAALKTQFNPSKLKVGQNISMRLLRHESVDDRAAVKELAIKLPNLSTVELQRLQDGSFSVASVKDPTKRELRRATGKVRSSLFQAAYDAGIPVGTMNELVKAFSYDVDFQRDIHPGDTIDVLTEREVASDGRVGKTGKASYAKLTLHGKTHEIYRFTNTAGVDGWYTASGNSVKKSLLRTPVNAARISSGFGMREHPVLGYSRMHRGVDFAAPTGTPILAAGDGVVKVAGWSNGYGNYVKIEHNATYATAYGHASRFAKGITPGAMVKQGQVIAYVGATGLATGAHLHYEILQNNTQVNPAQQKFNTAVALAGADMKRFRTQAAATGATLARLAPNTSQALNDTPAPAPAAKSAVKPVQTASKANTRKATHSRTHRTKKNG